MASFFGATTLRRQMFVYACIFSLLFFRIGTLAAADDTRNYDDILPRLIGPGESDLQPLLQESTDLIDEIFSKRVEREDSATKTVLNEPTTIEEFVDQFNERIQPASVEVLETTAYIQYLRRCALQTELRTLEQTEDVALKSIINAMTVANRMAALLEMIGVVGRHQTIVGDNQYGGRSVAAFFGAFGGAAGLVYTGTAYLRPFERQIQMQRHLIGLLERTNIPGTTTTLLSELRAVATANLQGQVMELPVGGTYADPQRRVHIARTFADDIATELGDEITFHHGRGMYEDLLVMQRVTNRHLNRMRRTARPLVEALNLVGGTSGNRLATSFDRLFTQMLTDYDSSRIYRAYADFNADAVVRGHRLDAVLTRAEHILGQAGRDNDLIVRNARRSLVNLKGRSALFRNWIYGKPGLRGRALVGSVMFGEAAVMAFCVYSLFKFGKHNEQWSDLGGDSAKKFEGEVEAFKWTGRKSTADLEDTLTKLNAEIAGLQQLWQEAGREAIDWPEIPPVQDLDRAMFELL